MNARRLECRNLQTCVDCGGACHNRDYYDPDNAENVAGIPPCDCRPRRPMPAARDC